MARRSRHIHAPKAHGWVTANDMLGRLLWFEDCNRGNAQEVLQTKFEQLAADGWTLEGRAFDFQFARRGDERISVGIYPTDPTKPLPRNMMRMPPSARVE